MGNYLGQRAMWGTQKRLWCHVRANNGFVVLFWGYKGLCGAVLLYIMGPKRVTWGLDWAKKALWCTF